MEKFVTINAAAKATGLSREFITAGCSRAINPIPHLNVSKTGARVSRRLRLSELENWLKKEMSAKNSAQVKEHLQV